MPSSVRWLLLAAVCTTTLAACATSPTGRSQLRLFPESQMGKMGFEAYQQVKKQTKADTSKPINQYVGCIVNALTAVTGKPRGGTKWTVTVFKEDKTVNAFALPGGNIGVYSGLLPVANTPAELAAVIGHEIGHVQAGHGNERMSDQYATQAGVQLISALAGGDPSNPGNQQLMSLLGLGAQVGILLPFSRAQESEADALGLRYMAQAGFDPREAIQLWHNMQASGGAKPPELLSTHPSDARRISDLQALMPEAMKLYKQALKQGHKPSCSPPKS